MMKMAKFFAHFLFLPFFVQLSYMSPQLTPVVQTSKGPIQGFYYNNSAVFLGIPFAAPPVGSLRFMRPMAPSPWKHTLKVTNFSAWCMQPLFSTGPENFHSGFTRMESIFPRSSPSYKNINFSEDCLYLNVFTPNLSPTTKYPVMFWVHGGGYVIGNAMTYTTDSIVSNLVSRGVVVVSTNYRLGLFGFYSTYSSLIPGNMGIRDQIAALEWTKNEISKFGGDPGQITIFGESAGGGSVSLLTMSPLSKGIISKAITQSGAAFCPWAFDGNYYVFSPASRDLAVTVNCTSKHFWSTNQISPSLVTCLQNVPAKQLQDAGGFGPWTPVVDGPGGVFPDWPRNLAKNRSKTLPMLIGSNHDEDTILCQLIGPLVVQITLCIVPVFDFGAQYLISNFTRALFDEIVHQMAPISAFGSKAPGVFQVIESAYLPMNPPLMPNDHLGWLKTIVEADSGYSFFAGIRKDIDIALAYGNPNVYVYSFDYISKTFPFVQNYSCVPHGQDLYYLFPGTWQYFNVFRPNVTWRFDANDTAISNWFGNTWTTFAKTGNLTSLGMLPITKANPTQYYSIDVPPKMMNYYHNIPANLWNNLIPSIMGGPPVFSSTSTIGSTTTTPSTSGTRGGRMSVCSFLVVICSFTFLVL